jgi:hypothetical protein
LVASAPGEALIITGPSRDDRAKLTEELSRRLIDNEKGLDSRSRRIIKLLAGNSEKEKIFYTKDFYIRMLEAIQHPIYGANAQNGPDGIKRDKKVERATEVNLITALKIGIAYCQTKYIVIEEIQQVLSIYGGLKSFVFFLESLISLARDTGVVLVLVGDYPISDAVKM